MGRVPRRPGGPWTGIVLAASVLASCLQPVPAQTPTPVTIVLTPPSPVVGGGVSLAPQPTPQNVVLCNWYRSATADQSSLILSYSPTTSPPQSNGPAHTGRETAGPGCVLNIAGLTLRDTGSYTVQIQTRASLYIGVNLTVYGPPPPDSPPGSSPPGLSAGAIAGIVIGSLAGVSLVGVGAYFLYSRFRNETPRENEAPVLVYENLPPRAGAGPVAQPGKSPDPGPTYQTLQPRAPDVYEELKK